MENTREFYEVYANYTNKPSERVAGYSKETALKVLEDETVKAIMHSNHLIMIDGRTGEIVKESKPNIKDLNKLIDTKINELMIEYCKQQCIIIRDISSQDNLILKTIKDALSDCIYEIINKNLVSFSPIKRTSKIVTW